jgi:restriction system protein
MPELFDKHAREQRRKYARWLDAEDPVVVANAMLIIIGRALNMLKSQIAAQGEAFEQTGGFSERLTTRRLQAREGQRVAGPAPQCPQCGQTMRRRKSVKGEFWGCAGFPECKRTRPVEEGDL